jgi:hypothetical protein
VSSGKARPSLNSAQSKRIKKISRSLEKGQVHRTQRINTLTPLGTNMKHITIATWVLGLSLMGCEDASDPIGAIGVATNGGGGTTGTSASSAASTILLPDAGLSNTTKATPAPPTAEANCGMQTSETVKSPTDVLLVLDRSGSMQESIADECCCSAGCRQTVNIKMCADTKNCTERWPALTSAVGNTIAKTAGIHWGLKMFSSPGGSDVCGVTGNMEAEIGAQATSIQTQIVGTHPKNSTPTAKAIIAATAYLKTVKDQNNKVMLLATDGEPNCRAGSLDPSKSDVDGTKSAIQAAVAAGFRVYVIGIGPSVGNLDTFAAAGGTNRFYRATSASDLADALVSISKAVSSCTFTMEHDPPDPDNIVVYLNGKLVANDPNHGWSMGATAKTILLNGNACTSVTSGAASTVRILFGCPDTTPPAVLF